MANGDTASEAEAERLYRDILPLIVFVMQSLDTLMFYGKRVAARRLGLDEVHNKARALALTAFGLQTAERHAARLGPLP
jgi:4-hydroxy-tetrahydrodipicolinate synthase